MHVAQFVHRYPPAIGGAEAYTARLCDYLASRGDSVTVWTTTAVELTTLASGVAPGETREQRTELSKPKHAALLCPLSSVL